MKILYYNWNENSADDMIETLVLLGHQVKNIHIDIIDYNEDSSFCCALEDELKKESYDLIFTFDFFPLISRTALKFQIPYISWIYDMPHTTLCSPEVKNEVNHIFIFDYNLYIKLKEKGYSSHFYHLSLGVNVNRLKAIIGEPPALMGQAFEVSFVGNLYESCLYNKIKFLPEYLKGYFDGIINSQAQIYGANIIDRLITPDILMELEKWVNLEIPSNYDITSKEMFTDMINEKCTSMERIELLTALAKNHHFTLFTGSNSKLIPNAGNGGIVSYNKDMPCVFRTSKININITLRSITSGIPLRALDIMGAGGFLMSNWQSELAEYFEDGKDLVLFESKEDMLAKTDYYLKHDTERNMIACNGYHKVEKYFSYEVQVKKILSQVFPLKEF